MRGADLYDDPAFLAGYRELRREKRSAMAPEGTSNTTAVSDQIVSSTEMEASDSPLSAKSNAYSA